LWISSSLPELPCDLKRMLRIQIKTLVDVIEDANLLAIRSATVNYLERCLVRDDQQLD
jgi:hypothetical protein